MKEGFGPEEKDLAVIVKRLIVDMIALEAEVNELAARVGELENPEAPDVTPPMVTVVRPG